MRKVVALLALLIALAGCGKTEEVAPFVDPCVKVNQSEREAYKKWDGRVGQKMDPTQATSAKLEVLQWAFIITGNPTCFTSEKVALAKSTITILSASRN